MPPPDRARSSPRRRSRPSAAGSSRGPSGRSTGRSIPPSRPPVPECGPRWARNPIDRFILARLEAGGLAPSPEADRVTLIRRLSFDLTGLPPTPEEVDAFVADERPDAYEKLVDRLLASPHYGERMAMYWLDLVRYADTVGYHGDQEHPISPYRDYVIDAFNANMPFDQFTVEQLAGDLLPERDDRAADRHRLQPAAADDARGRGAGRRSTWRSTPPTASATSRRVWLGATLGCAECHDHKFDPYTAKDFYAPGRVLRRRRRRRGALSRRDADDARRSRARRSTPEVGRPSRLDGGREGDRQPSWLDGRRGVTVRGRDPRRCAARQLDGRRRARSSSRRCRRSLGHARRADGRRADAARPGALARLAPTTR